MRFLTAFFSGAAGLCVILAAIPAAEAQSVFQKLFGFASEPAPQAVPQPQVRQVIPPARLRSHRRLSRRLADRLLPGLRVGHRVAPLVSPLTIQK